MANQFVFPLLALSLLSIFVNGLFANKISLVEHATTTKKNDVKGIAAFQSAFIGLGTIYYSGDPCTENTGLYLWSQWVTCNSASTPRIIAINLPGNGYNLYGPLPDFSSMDALETIDLSGNALTGSIPDFLGTLPNLKSLDLRNNLFTGTVPASLSKNKNLNYMVSGNDNLCTSKSCGETDTPNTDSGTPYTYTPVYYYQKKKKSKLPIILGILIPSFAIFWAVVGFFATMHHKRKAAAVAAMSQGTNVPEMKGQEGEINMAAQMDQQGNGNSYEKEHVFTNQEHVNP